MKLVLSLKTATSFFFKATYLFCLCLILLDLFVYEGFVQSNFVTPLWITSSVALVHGILRIITKQKLSDGFIKLNLYVFAPLVLFLTAFLYYLEESGILFSNYFFATFGIHYAVLATFLIPTVVLAGVHIDKQFLHKNWQNVLLMSTALLILGANVVYTLRPGVFSELIVEDGLIEYLTMVAYAASAWLAFAFIGKRKVFKKKSTQVLFILGCCIVGIGLLFVAGEEISWGQRILKIETPAWVDAQNRQGEINLHNSEVLWPFVYVGYAAIGIYGMITWIVYWLVKDVISLNTEQRLWKELLVPKQYLFLNFAFISFYVWLRELHGPWRFQHWEEYAELILVAGILIHLFVAFHHFSRSKK